MNSSNVTDKKVDVLYRVGRAIVVLFLKAFYGIKTVGRENIPNGAALFCANHSNWMDPLFLAVAVNGRRQLHFMAKKELFANKFIAWLLGKVGAFPVDRAGSDVSAIRKALVLLKKGSKVGIFPEGTRALEDNAVRAKPGALKIAERAAAPVVPAYVPRKKRLFRRNTVVIGEAYYINPDRKKLTSEEYETLADELMKKISELKPASDK